MSNSPLIAKIADLVGYGDHLHFGARMGAYSASVSGVGALPVEECGEYPAFPDGFVDPEDEVYVVFE